MEVMEIAKINCPAKRRFLAIIQHGTMTLIRKKAMAEVGDWSEWCICEDAELGLRLLNAGYEVIYIPHSFGKGLSPNTFKSYKLQRFRWAFGAMQILHFHRRKMLGYTKDSGSQLSLAQRFHFVAGWLPWIGDGALLVLSVVAIFWSFGAVAFHHWIEIPPGIFIMPALIIFFAKLFRSSWLYRSRLKYSWGESFLACLAGLSLVPTIGLAVLKNLVDQKLPFHRTPKSERGLPLFQVLSQCRYEFICGALLLISSGMINFYFGELDPEARLWSLFLCSISIPYLAAVAMSVISMSRKSTDFH